MPAAAKAARPSRPTWLRRALVEGPGLGEQWRAGEKLVQDLVEEASGPSCGGKGPPVWGQETGGERPFQTSMAQWGDESLLEKTPHILGPVALGSVEISWTISMV